MELTKRYQQDPVIVKVVHKELTVTNIDQVYYEVRNSMKQEVLSRILDMHNMKSVIIFCNTKARVNYVSVVLKRFGYDADALSSAAGH
jgi:ATP-dependent RNA helicase DeaD